MKIMVDPTQLINTANKLTSLLLQFTEAFDASQQAADALIAGWEGDASIAFAVEQGNFRVQANSILKEMQWYATEARTLANRYQQLDQQMSGELHS